MEEQPEENLPPIPEEILPELTRMIEDGSIKWMPFDHPLRRKIPPAYFILDVDFINTLVRAGVKGIPGITIVPEIESRIRKLQVAHQELGKQLEAARVDGETNELMIQRILHSLFAHLAHTIDDEKTFVRLARETYRQAHGAPRRGPRPLKEDCFWAIDSSLGPSGHGFPPFHWAQRASKSEGRISLPYPFNDTSRPHVRPTMAELIRMIQASVSDPKTGRMLPESTARKYARLWEKQMYPQILTMSERWTLHKARKKAKKPRH